MSAAMELLYSIVLVIVSLVSMVTSSGRLIEPAMRSSLWRFNDKARINFNDNGLDCGGSQVRG